MRLFNAALFLSLLSVLMSVAARADIYAFVPRSDGTITRFRAETRTGKLTLLPGAAQTGIHRPVSLVLSADKRFLYVYPTFDIAKDGYDLEFQTEKIAKAAHSKPTPIVVFFIEHGGVLKQKQTLVVPGPVGQIAVHPGGRFLYALTHGGTFLLRTGTERGGGKGSAGLTFAGRLPISSGMGLVNTAGERDAWWLTFSPGGNFLYDFWGDGFVDHAENYLQRYQINPATGQAMPVGTGWNSRREGNLTVPSPGSIWRFVNNTAFVQGFAQGFYACPVDRSGKMIGGKGSLALEPKKQSNYYYALQTLITYPTLPLVFYRGSFADPYTIWRVAAPGKVVKVSVFSSAFRAGVTPSLAIDPSGRFLYETAPPDALVKAPLVAVFALSENATQAKLVSPPRPLPFGSDTNITLVSILPANGRTTSQ